MPAIKPAVQPASTFFAQHKLRSIHNEAYRYDLCLISLPTLRDETVPRYTAYFGRVAASITFLPNNLAHGTDSARLSGNMKRS